MRSSHLIRTLIACCSFALAATPALAKDDDHGHGKDKDKHYQKSHEHGDKDRVVMKIDSSDRNIILDYFDNHRYPGHRYHCPPGLAKKNRDCMPPGQYKKFHRGDILPDGIWSALPWELSHRLHPPHGSRYVMVDRDVYPISEATKKVIDAFTLLSGVQ